MALTIGVGTSELSDTAEAFGEASREARAKLAGPCDLCAVFAAGRHLTEPESVLEAVGAELDPRTLFGCGAGGVVGSGRELESGPAAVVWAASLPGADVASHHLLASGDAEPIEVPTGWEAMLLLVEPSSFATEPALGALAEAAPGRPVIGGLASASVGGGGVLFRDGEVLREGAVGVTLDGVPLIPCVSQGAAPVGPALEVTAAEGNLIVELEGDPALHRLGAAINDLEPREQTLAESGVMLGLAVEPGHPEVEDGELLVRPIIGADRERGVVAIAEQVRQGQTVRLCVRDGTSADTDLREALSLRSEALGDTEAAGALLFTCNGRGMSMFPEPDHDAKALLDVLGVEAGGFFCAGEIGPVAGRSFLHGFTATIAVFPAE